MHFPYATYTSGWKLRKNNCFEAGRTNCESTSIFIAGLTKKIAPYPGVGTDSSVSIHARHFLCVLKSLNLLPPRLIQFVSDVGLFVICNICRLATDVAARFDALRVIFACQMLSITAECAVTLVK